MLFLLHDHRFPYADCQSSDPIAAFEGHWERPLRKAIDKVVHVGEVARFEWDRVFIFRAYTPASEVAEATHTPDYVGDRLFRHVPNVETLIVFMSSTRPVCGYRWRGGYLESPQREFARAEASFEVEKRCPDCPFVLRPGYATALASSTAGLGSRCNGPGLAGAPPACRGR